LFHVEEWAGLKPSAIPKTPQAPTERWHKVNADGAFLWGSGVGGSGAVLWDHNGWFVAGTGHFLPSVANPKGAELLACKAALVLAKERGVTKVCLISKK
jgi:ribonuclease HI